MWNYTKKNIQGKGVKKTKSGKKEEKNSNPILYPFFPVSFFVVCIENTHPLSVQFGRHQNAKVPELSDSYFVIHYFCIAKERFEQKV
jgi:hypothetical protein